MYDFEPFASCYIVRDEDRKLFGKNWCGPEKYEHGKRVLIAKYKKQEKSDGQDVEVYCFAMPATFYIIKALRGKNSINKPQSPYEVSTGANGTEMTKLAVTIAEQISEGMLGFYPIKK